MEWNGMRRNIFHFCYFLFECFCRIEKTLQMCEIITSLNTLITVITPAPALHLGTEIKISSPGNICLEKRNLFHDHYRLPLFGMVLK